MIKKIEWTIDQNSAIKKRGTDLLVSASAGAGKTAVMTERIASMIENKEAAVSDLLVLTFTNASAADMKAKLCRRLKANLDSASIGTFHKFCGELVRTYFNITDVSPDFDILDETDSDVIKSEILDTVIARNYDRLDTVINSFCVNRKTDELKKLLIKVYNFLTSRDNADEWLEKSALASYDTDLAMRIILDYYQSAGKYYLARFKRLALTEKEAPYLKECIDLAGLLTQIKGYDDLHNIALTPCFTQRLKPKMDEDFKGIREKFKDLLKKVSEHYSVSGALIAENQKRDRSLVIGIIELVKDFEKEYALAKQNKLDFNDLEKYACVVLDNPDAARAVSQKYKYIFIDEYQDTNPMQERILMRVADNKNIFMVGDIKQSIYGFRGCEAAIFAEKMAAWEQGKVVKLNKNFRSKSNILEFVNQVFGRIMKDNVAQIDYNKTSKFNVEKCDSDKESPGTAEVILVNTPSGSAVTAQAAIIAERISTLIREGVNPEDIAILSRSRNHFDELTSVLRSAGIAAAVNSAQSASELFEIALLNNMLFAVSNFYNDVPLVLLMSSFVFGFTPDELAQIKTSGKEDCFYKLLSNQSTEKVQKFLAFLDKYRALAKTHCVADVVNLFLAEYKIIDRLLILPDGKVMVENIYSFLNILRGASYGATVSGYLYLLENDLLDIKIKPPQAAKNCVQIMTMHSSKGLEFPVVFIYDTGAAFNASDTRQLMVIDKKCGMCVYSLDADEFVKTHSIARLAAVINSGRVMIAEEMRLFYVALTRAKHRLIVVGGGNIDSIKANYTGDFEVSDFDILSAKNYLHFLAPTVFAGVRDKCFSVKVFDADEIEVVSKAAERRVLTGEYDKELAEKLRQIFNKPYPYKTDVVLKTSVTALTQAESKFVPEHRTEKKKITDSGKEYGTKVHKEMQKMDTAKLERLIPEIKGYKIYRELPFLLSNNQANSSDGADASLQIVQGVIDLLAVKDGNAIIIDYKTNHISEKNLVDWYSPQLKMYCSAVKTALDSDVQAYIYSTVHKKLIKV